MYWFFKNIAKTFDTVNHNILLQKLILYCIALNLLSSYLINRTHRLRVNNTFSSCNITNCGVPQGCVVAFTCPDSS